MTLPSSALLQDRSVDAWQCAEGLYDSALEAVGKKRKAWPLLRDLEEARMKVPMWHCLRERSTIEFGKSQEELTLDTLTEIVKWKITRGKFRPLMKLVREPGHTTSSTHPNTEHLKPLVEQVRSNSEAAVKDAWAAAEAKLKRRDFLGAVVALTSLRGVGVATASAVLSAREASIPFMSDEAILACDIPRNARMFWYDLPTYKEVFTHIREVSKELRSVEGGDEWTPERIQRCLWAINNKPEDTCGENNSGKRKRDN